MKVSEILSEGLKPGQGIWKREMIAKGAVSFRQDTHAGGTVNRNVATLNDKVVAVFNRKNGQGTIFSEGH